MTIEKNRTGEELLLVVSGRIDTTTAPELEAAVEESLKEIKAMTFDFKDLEYISSAGLRILLSAHKALGDCVVVKGVNDAVKEVFDVTGFGEVIKLA